MHGVGDKQEYQSQCKKVVPRRNWSYIEALRLVVAEVFLVFGNSCKSTELFSVIGEVE